MPLSPQLLSFAENSRLILLLGANDTGKTTLTAALAQYFLQKGEKVAVIDADLGQSDIGPPTTLGLAFLEKEFASWSDIEPRSLYFVGSTSPIGHLLETVAGTYHLTRQAQALVAAKILVDTSGLISGGAGWALKNYKLELLRPDLIVALEKKGELAAILAPWEKREGVEVLRIKPHEGVRRRSAEERKARREEAYLRYFREKEVITLSWQETPFIQIPWGWGKVLGPREREPLVSLLNEEVLWGETGGDTLFLVTPLRLSPMQLRRLVGLWGASHIMNVGLQELPGAYLGLEMAEEETHVLGRLISVDFLRQSLELEIPAAKALKKYTHLLLPKKLLQTV